MTRQHDCLRSGERTERDVRLSRTRQELIGRGAGERGEAALPERSGSNEQGSEAGRSRQVQGVQQVSPVELEEFARGRTVLSTGCPCCHLNFTPRIIEI